MYKPHGRFTAMNKSNVHDCNCKNKPTRVLLQSLYQDEKNL